MAQPKTQKRAAIPTARRQAVLDQLNKHGAQSARQLAEALKSEPRTVNTYLRELRTDKEIKVAHEEKRGNIVVPFYAALVTKTHVPPPPVVDEPETLSEVTRAIAPGHIQHLGTHRRRPLQNPGGQGQVGAGSGVASSLGGGPLFVKL